MTGGEPGAVGPVGPVGPVEPAGPAGPESAGPEPVGPGSAGPGAADPGAPVVERRLHPFTPLRRAWVPIGAGIGVLGQQADRAQEWARDAGTGLGTLILVAVLVAASLYGFLSWRFTSYAVTDTELRIRTGLIFRRTAHIRLDRLQAVDVTRPLLARLTGVAKLKLDVIGTEEKDELAFLGERVAQDLRAELLARAAGFAPAEAARVGEAPGRALLRVPGGRLATSLLLSLGVWAALTGGLAGALIVWRASDNLIAGLALLLPMLGGAWAASGGRFLAEYDWTVEESPDGLRLDHGLLDRAHETVPPGRVQSVRIVEPLLWRRRDWVRVELAVAGSKNDVLVPVAARQEAYAVVARVLPGVDLTALAFAPSPRRGARWVVPVWWKGYGLAVSPQVFAARKGRLCRRTEIVPHAKVQSVRLTQGPWERARGVADVHVDTGADGTVTARLRPAPQAHALLAAQATRSRTGRATSRPDRWMT
ncbi:PH domain-containing protein [Streptomyces antimicrobicus]|uniref:PH domain-containing protein n=1 Tax=Streptomyces antimicrobicus TaxID=2883108 RepID=A0ABS8B619_9ACTN|nr:PH domain-containing protein [Streptomyces antimicrobicus]MCB5180037.1 PH domain-containing protein [Streptomyces antimicrobicus]